MLSSKQEIAQYDAILDEFNEKQRASLKQSGGYIKVHFSYDYDYRGVNPPRMLILYPKDKKDGEIVTSLCGGDNGRILGPFSAGDYLAAMVTMGAKTKKILCHTWNTKIFQGY
jgi:hypothetical protein